MPNANVIVVTGLPGSGKTTLARELAARWRWPLIAKDLIKEPLLDVLGAPDAAQSRRLSDASFAVLFDIARELVAAGTSFLLEGNFRAGEHEGPLMRALKLRDSGLQQPGLQQPGLQQPGLQQPGLHEPDAPLAAANERAAHAEVTRVRVAQILCRVPEAERRARLQARTTLGFRHVGHHVGEQASLETGASNSADEFLELPSKRLIYPSTAAHPVHASLDDWMNLRAPSP